MHKRLLNILERLKFQLAFTLGRTGHYDVGLVGLWYGRNYGSMVSYYSLHRHLQSMGLSVLMISNPLRPRREAREFHQSPPGRLARACYQVSRQRHLGRMRELNKLCDAFIVGSDQLWNYALSRPYQQMYFLDFAGRDRKKISFATSFGKDHYAGPDEYTSLAARNLARFAAISVREDSGVELCRKHFGVEATRVVDPVFLSSAQDYADLIGSSETTARDHVFAYLLDPDREMRDAVKHVARQLGTRAVVVLDENPKRIQQNVRQLEPDPADTGLVLKEQVDVGGWLAEFKHCRFVVTDSYHGICMAIIFRKPFIAVRNMRRGGDRFDSLADLFMLQERLVATPAEIPGHHGISSGIDYDAVAGIVDDERRRAAQWLKVAL